MPKDIQMKLRYTENISGRKIVLLMPFHIIYLAFGFSVDFVHFDVCYIASAIYIRSVNKM